MFFFFGYVMDEFTDPGGAWLFLLLPFLLGFFLIRVPETKGGRAVFLAGALGLLVLVDALGILLADSHFSMLLVPFAAVAYPFALGAAVEFLVIVLRKRNFRK